MEKKHTPVLETIEYENKTLYRFYHNFEDSHIPFHWHNAVEIIMPIKDTYQVKIRNKVYVLNECDILIIPSGELHENDAPEKKGQRIFLQFDIAALNAISGFIDMAHVYMSPRLITPEISSELHEKIKLLLLEMLDEHMSRLLFHEVSIMNKILSLTLYLARIPYEEENGLENIIKQKTQLVKFNHCVEYINRSFMENITLEMAARIVSYSKFHFSRWFQQLAGVPFIDYLTNVRLDNAKSMLINSTRLITEIALESGFQSTSTFNRIFKERYKCTPSEYRSFHRLHETEDSLMTANKSIEDSPFIKLKTAPSLPVTFTGKKLCGVSRVHNDDTFCNPFIYADIPDPCVIRVENTYYMSSTTMYFNPGCPIMRSYDLVNWEIINYVYDILDDSDKNCLRNGVNAYGKGSWASSLRFHKGTFYVVVASFTTDKTYIFQTENIENGPWRRYTLDRVYHDPSLFFEDDGRVFIIYGGGTIRIVELTADAAAEKPGGLQGVLIEKANVGGDGGLPAEGSHFYKINGKYYLFLIAWPNFETGRRIELCYRADTLQGPYEGKVVLNDDMGIRNRGVAQGGIVDTPDGNWYAMLFQDYGAVGRIPVLVPVAWQEEWPVFGLDGSVPNIMPLPKAGFNQYPITISDEFYQSEISKNYKADNDTSYAYNHLNKSLWAQVEPGPTSELIVNGQFADGIRHWSHTGIAEISVIQDKSIQDSPVLFVSGRATTGSGLKQDITGKVIQGGIYEVTARVFYAVGPDYKDFYISIYNGPGWETIQNMGAGRIKKGEWGVISGTYTLPADADLSETVIFLETPWLEKPKKDIDLIDFYVESVSMVQKPLHRLAYTLPGENDANGSLLSLQWQFNHNPDHNHWSLTDRPGYLRLKAGYLCDILTDARNTLTQRTFGPECTGVTALEVKGMRDGDAAGLAALQEEYGYVGVKQTNGKRSIVMASASSGHEEEIESILLDAERVYLKIDFDFNIDTAYFYYSLDEIHWKRIGGALPMRYKLSHFTGYRFALFYYATQTIGGYADFNYFRVGDACSCHDENLIILNASLGENIEAPGVHGTKIELPLNMESLPKDSYKGIYFSLCVPPCLLLEEVAFCYDNISNQAVYTYANGRLQIAITGDDVSFYNKKSDLLAILRFTVNGFVDSTTRFTLRPDYLHVEGGNVVYDVHNMWVDITLTQLETKAIAKIPGYANPLISYKYGADPWALVYENRVYLYLTCDKFEYENHGRLISNTYGASKTISLISSVDLLNWTDHGEIIITGPTGATSWAEYAKSPAVTRKMVDGKEKFYLYFANDAEGIGVLTADSPTGPWFDPLGRPLIDRHMRGVEDVVWCVDPAVLVDDDGKGYLYFGGGLPSQAPEDVLYPKTARVIRLGDDMISTVGEAVVIDAPAFFEASGINKINGRYYYSYSTNFAENRPIENPGHGEIAYMISDSPLGPFEYKGVLLKNPHYFFGVGGNNHHCIFYFNNSWYITYHAQTLGQAVNRVKGYRSPHINKLSLYGNGLIYPVTADRIGSPLAVQGNPYVQNESVTFAWCAGITTKTGKCGMYVTDIHDNDWLAVAQLHFNQSGKCRFIAEVSSCVGGEIEIRIDSLHGKCIGMLGTGETGGDDHWVIKSCDVENPVGIHHLFFIFKGDSEYILFNFKSWRFEIY